MPGRAREREFNANAGQACMCAKHGLISGPTSHSLRAPETEGHTHDIRRHRSLY